MSPFLTHVTHVQITITLGFSKRKLLLYEYFFSFRLSRNPFRSFQIHRLFPQHQCCKHTVWENTDWCCPYGNSTPGHSALKMSLFQSSLPLWLLVYLRKFLWNTQFLTFCLSIYCLDFKWFAMTAKTCFGSTTLKSAQNLRPEKKFGWRWMVNCGRCVASWLLHLSLNVKQSGFKPWLGTLCCVLGHNTYFSLPSCINGNWLT